MATRKHQANRRTRSKSWTRFNAFLIGSFVGYVLRGLRALKPTSPMSNALLCPPRADAGREPNLCRYCRQEPCACDGIYDAWRDRQSALDATRRDWWIWRKQIWFDLRMPARDGGPVNLNASGLLGLLICGAGEPPHLTLCLTSQTVQSCCIRFSIVRQTRPLALLAIPSTPHMREQGAARHPSNDLRVGGPFYLRSTWASSPKSMTRVTDVQPAGI